MLKRPRRDVQIAERQSRTGQRRRGRASTGAKPSCEALDGRQLLSTVEAAAAPAVLPTPPATAVANAAAELNTIDATGFAAFERDLSLAETHSHVTPAEVGNLAQDEAALDQAINAAGLGANPTSTDLNQVQDVIDHAFLDNTLRAKGWAGKQQTLQQDLAGVPGVTPLINRTIAQMQVVARAARPTGAMPGVISDGAQTRNVILPANLAPEVLERTFPQAWRDLENAVASTPATSLGPTTADQHPLEVYYDGQVNNFIKG
jgi:hypothetical protein